MLNSPKKTPIVIKTLLLQETKLQSYSSKVKQASKLSPPKTITKKKKTVAKKKIVKKVPRKIVKKKKIAVKKNPKKQTTKPLIASKKTSVKKQQATNKLQSGKKDAGKIKNDYNLYISRISEVFTNFLVLPEPGSVLLAITIKGDKVQKIVTISSESSKNLRYLQENLPKLSLPVGLTKYFTPLK